MIDVHTHLTYVQENPVTQAGRGAAVVYLAAANREENHRDRRHHGARSRRPELFRHRHARTSINKGLMMGPRMFIAGYGLQVQRGVNVTANNATGPTEVMRVVRLQVFAGGRLTSRCTVPPAPARM